ncbi:MAG: Rieske 2Fe-2S domain-containing protein [Actinomycetota bacterium]|nr:Rieske 2Fe-2S domain-containing protein [Actinomycetota bacterium]
MGWSLFPVRLFLGLTFVYGGIQKLSDPGFLHPGAPTYIGTQLRGFANGTPGGFLLRAFALPHPGLSGVGVSLVEIAVGVLVTTGLLIRPAAAAGLALNLVLFLTNSWHTYPYFLGSDIVFVFAWVPFVLAGARRQPTLEPMLHRLVATRTPGGGHVARLDGRGADRPRSDPDFGGTELTRRTAIGAALSVVSAATAAIAGLSLLARGSFRAPRSLSASVPRHPAVPAAAKPASPGAGPQTHAAELPSGAVKLGAASQLPAGQGATYPDPGDGQPDIVIREPNGSLVAHSAVCTHTGCTVGYQGGQIVCPCHGSVFDAQTGAVISGPAPTPLAPRKVIERGGEIYALPA